MIVEPSSENNTYSHPLIDENNNCNGIMNEQPRVQNNFVDPITFIDPSIREYIIEMILESDYYNCLVVEQEQQQQKRQSNVNSNEDDDDVVKTEQKQTLIETVASFMDDDTDVAQQIINNVTATHLSQNVCSRPPPLLQQILPSSFDTKPTSMTPNDLESNVEDPVQVQVSSKGSQTYTATVHPTQEQQHQHDQHGPLRRKRKDKATKGSSNNVTTSTSATTTTAAAIVGNVQSQPLPSIMVEDNNLSNNYEIDIGWMECQQNNSVWGGRGQGGRGAYANQTNSIHGNNIHLYNVSLSLSSALGNTSSGTNIELLDSTITNMDIQKYHRYGLIGRNGVGKSTLLRALAYHTIPGIPHNMRILYVDQNVDGVNVTSTRNHTNNNNTNDKDQNCDIDEIRTDAITAPISVIDSLIQSDIYRNKLLQEQSVLEQALDNAAEEEEEARGRSDYNNIEQIMERLTLIESELDRIDSDTVMDRAEKILIGLQFTSDMIHGSITKLSGGWRMRLSLARALFLSSYDLILLDEVTNHLDLAGLDWLVQYINQSKMTMILVSHDTYFLDAVCTDIIVMEHQTLTYHVGNYSMYQKQIQEKAARETQILDAAERQRSSALAFIQKQQSNKKSTDPNKQRQAKMIRDKKLDRIGNYREDGKRYKLRSLKTLDETSLRLAQKVQIEVDEQPLVQLRFPNPIWSPSIGVSESIIRIEDLSFYYSSDISRAPILSNITLNIQRGSKIALVGPNGSGKSTLIKLIAGEHTHNVVVQGSIWINPTIRVGHVSQYTVEEMDMYTGLTVLEYAEQHIIHGRAASDIVKKASGNIRQYLGGFGLGGKHALQCIGKLSGGERMRLCFAKVLAENPNILLLDESTNHCDIQLLESMSNALNEFTGTVLMVSHNQSFLSGFCNELWVLQDGRVNITHDDTETFDEMFTKYRCSIAINDKGAVSSIDQRRNKTQLSKRATNQRAGAKESTALL